MTTRAYYNEIDKFNVAWLKELMKAGVIAPGEVDDRSIEDVQSSDLKGFTQCHFFAGIGVWSYALRAAGWPDDSPVWTGSCPCQGFSTSGKGEGFSDKRHLWPVWFRLASKCRPHTIFGEQVASKAGLAWLDVVSADLEGKGYAIGAADLCAASSGAPHIRQRLFFCAHPKTIRRKRFQPRSDHLETATQSEYVHADYGLSSGVEAISECERRRTGSFREGCRCSNESNEAPERLASQLSATHRRQTSGSSNPNGGNASAERLRRSGTNGLRSEDCEAGNRGNSARCCEGACVGESSESRESQEPIGRPSSAGDSLITDSPGRRTRQQTSATVGHGSPADAASCACGSHDSEQSRPQRRFENLRDARGPGWLDPFTARSVAEAGTTRGFWSDCDWWYGRDEKYRPIEPGLFPLVNGAAHRMVKLRGYGNALVAPLAQAF